MQNFTWKIRGRKNKCHCEAGLTWVAICRFGLCDYVLHISILSSYDRISRVVALKSLLKFWIIRLLAHCTVVHTLPHARDSFQTRTPLPVWLGWGQRPLTPGRLGRQSSEPTNQRAAVLWADQSAGDTVYDAAAAPVGRPLRPYPPGPPHVAMKRQAQKCRESRQWRIWYGIV